MSKDFTHRRARYIPAGAIRISDKSSDAVVHVYSSASGNPCAVGFHGKAGKPDWRYRFSNEASREKHVADYFAGERANAERKAERRAAKVDRGLVVGDILRASWGYDQTNIDYYEVTKMIGKSMVEIREIGCESEGTEYMQGKSVPVPGNFVGDPMRKKAANGTVAISSFEFAHKMEPAKVIGGKPVFNASHWTAYA